MKRQWTIEAQGTTKLLRADFSTLWWTKIRSSPLCVFKEWIVWKREQRTNWITYLIERNEQNSTQGQGKVQHEAHTYVRWLSDSVCAAKSMNYLERLMPVSSLDCFANPRCKHLHLLHCSASLAFAVQRKILLAESFSNYLSDVKWRNFLIHTFIHTATNATTKVQGLPVIMTTSVPQLSSAETSYSYSNEAKRKVTVGTEQPPWDDDDVHYLMAAVKCYSTTQVTNGLWLLDNCRNHVELLCNGDRPVPQPNGVAERLKKNAT